MLIFYDFEVFLHDWLVVFINPIERWDLCIENDADALTAFYAKHKESIFVGYNNRHYDSYIYKGILLGFDPHKINDFLIVDKQAGWSYSDEFRKIPMNNYDVAKINDGGLKTLEAYMGNDIRETSVPFDIQRKLTPEELAETRKYCYHDVEQTIEVFMRRKSDFDAHMALLTEFSLPISDISKTQVRLVAKILDCTKRTRRDEFDITIVDTLKLCKYSYIKTWFVDQMEKGKKSGEYPEESLKCTIAGVEHTFGWGGVHGAKEQYHAKGLFLHVDVNSYYPSLMIEYGWLTRNSRNPEKYTKIYEHRLALKAAGKKKEQAPYKIVLNGTFGGSKDKTSQMYDPHQANEICINGQLLLVDLIEKLEAIPDFELIQSNTDGLIIKIPDTDEAFEMADDICYEWEKRTGMGLGFDIISEIWQKDVNNYVFKFQNGGIERKGGYVQESSDLKRDLAIVNEALVAYMTENIPIEKTINECSDLKMFMKVVKVSQKYLCGWHNGKRLKDKTFRIFASKNPNDGYIEKQKNSGAKPEKFANTPEHCLIYNERIDEDTKLDIDKQWYIDLARKRLRDFGLEV